MQNCGFRVQKCDFFHEKWPNNTFNLLLTRFAFKCKTNCDFRQKQKFLFVQNTEKIIFLKKMRNILSFLSFIYKG